MLATYDCEHSNLRFISNWPSIFETWSHTVLSLWHMSLSFIYPSSPKLFVDSPSAIVTPVSHFNTWPCVMNPRGSDVTHSHHTTLPQLLPAPCTLKPEALYNQDISILHDVGLTLTLDLSQQQALQPSVCNSDKLFCFYSKTSEATTTIKNYWSTCSLHNERDKLRMF